jgi:putative spermidine/putrescine transport system permease protein
VAKFHKVTFVECSTEATWTKIIPMRKLSIAFFLIVGVLPLAAGLTYALLYSIGLVGALATGFTLSPWVSTLGDAGFWSAMGLSVLMAGSVLLLSSALAWGVLRLLAPDEERSGLRFWLYLPLALPPIVAAFVSFQGLGNSGMVARGAAALGFIQDAGEFPPLINDPAYLGVGFTLTMMTFPVLLIVFLHQYKHANAARMAALAATLGATPAQISRRVLLPIVLRRAAPTLMLYAVFLFGAFEVPLLLGRQSPAMISLFIHQKLNRFNLDDLPIAYAATVLYAVVMVSFVVFFSQKQAHSGQAV